MSAAVSTASGRSGLEYDIEAGPPLRRLAGAIEHRAELFEPRPNGSQPSRRPGAAGERGERPPIQIGRRSCTARGSIRNPPNR
jgi:hypothetical protein